MKEIKHESYWRENWQKPQNSNGISNEPPQNVDVLIIGSGYTGLNAAIETARGGLATAVLEAKTLGFGCSTRNGGQISTSIKPSLEKLKKKYGVGRARAIRLEGQNALNWIEQRIKKENIDCDFEKCGRFHAAHTPKHFQKLVRESELLEKQENIPIEIVERQNQKNELGTENYFGGVIFPKHCSLHAGKYHVGLLNCALDSGAQIIENCAAQKITRTKNGFEVKTEKGIVRAANVAIATNGYTSISGWHRRRIVPIGSYIIASDELPQDLLHELFPTNKIASDTRKIVYYFRKCPEHKKILFGGRVSANETNTHISAQRLYNEMCFIFPQLKNYGISHSWSGTVGYTFDELAHIGKQHGIYYAMGYCGSGVSMASYLGMKMGQKILGSPKGATAFDGIDFPTKLFYYKKTFFSQCYLAGLIGYYRFIDKMQYSRALARNKI